MSCEQDTAGVIRRAGHKLTPQRMMILTALRHAGGHVTASDLLGRVQRDYPYVDISTVYRTLHTLKQLRLVTETDMGTGDTAYEWARSERHHHLICTACGAVEEINHEHLDRLGGDIEREYGFRPVLDHFAIFGLCRDCSRAEDQEESDS